MGNFLCIFLPPATKLGQGYIFTGVCHSVSRGGVWSWGVSASGGWVSALGGCAPGGCLVETPQHGRCCGQYTSYWNAFFLPVVSKT